MKRIYRILAVTTLSASLIGPMSFAQDHPDEHHDTYVRHDEWKKGYHMKQEDWNRARPVDYRQNPEGLLLGGRAAVGRALAESTYCPEIRSTNSRTNRSESEATQTRALGLRATRS